MNKLKINLNSTIKYNKNKYFFNHYFYIKYVFIININKNNFISHFILYFLLV